MQRSLLDALQMVYDMMEKEAASFADDEDAEFQAEEERLLQAFICLDLQDQTMLGRHLLPRGLPCIAAYSTITVCCYVSSVYSNTWA